MYLTRHRQVTEQCFRFSRQTRDSLPAAVDFGRAEEIDLQIREPWTSIFIQNLFKCTLFARFSHTVSTTLVFKEVWGTCA